MVRPSVPSPSPPPCFFSSLFLLFPFASIVALALAKLIGTEQFYPQYTINRSSSGELEPLADEAPTYPVPWVTSLEPPSEAIAVEVEVKAGQTLYLPSGWWHRVSQSPGEGGLAVAVN